MQKYLFKVGPVDMVDGGLLPGIVDFFAEGAAAGKGVVELIGTDVAAFADGTGLVEFLETADDIEIIVLEPGADEK